MSNKENKAPYSAKLTQLKAPKRNIFEEASMPVDALYDRMLDTVMFYGEDFGDLPDRPLSARRSVFGYQERYDLRFGFPLLATKKTPLRWIAEELFWFLSGSTNVRYLQEKNVPIWNQWENSKEHSGDLGPIYGKQWRSFGSEYAFDVSKNISDNLRVCSGHDQITELIEEIKNNPTSRRHIVTAWDPAGLKWIKENKFKSPPPCHILFQIYASPEGWLDLQLYQRSADLFVGVPFNIASYSLLLMLIAQVTGRMARYFIHSFGDLHLYRHHFDAVQELRKRPFQERPELSIDPKVTDLFSFKWEHLKLLSYNPHDTIPVEVTT